MSLTQVRLQVGSATHTSTATGCCTFVCAKVGASLGASSAVDEFVSCETLCNVARALEDTGVHVGGASRSDDGHGSTVHVDFSGDINDTVWGVECTLTPGLEDLTVDEAGATVDWCPSS